MTTAEYERSSRLSRLQESVDTWFGACGANEEAAAMVETAFLMAAADGEINTAEYEQLVGTIVIVTGDRVGSDRVRVVMSQLLEVLQIDGWEARVESVGRAIRSPEARRNAYRLAAGVSFVDGHIHPDEMNLFALLAEAFEIPIDEASQILREVRDMLYGSSRATADEPVILLTTPRRRTNPG
jgi:tellurite resistance protein